MADIKQIYERPLKLLDTLGEGLNEAVAQAVQQAVESAVREGVHQVVRDLSGTLLADRMVSHIFSIQDGLITRFDIGEE